MRTVAPSAGLNCSVVPVSVFVSLSMNGIHVTMGKMKRLSVLLLLVLAGMQVRGEPAQYTIKVGVDLVNVPFTVTDRHGRLIPGLTAPDFAVEEDGRRQDILNF